ncbi:VOC family protein [Halobellus sp. H-GB7]|uniref:VOC family protein n=1 Tax=Halobellus sp. H-GB7 TaxID=3069756 RepID=UPI0027B24869|nr:VOC family protein [Halobellus sp. H-GB7]MDQ2056194.1 VOC family protein [Halobellus sp. H-GB7]
MTGDGTSNHETPIHVDHVGIAVESVEDAAPVLDALGCERLLDDTVDGEFRWVYYSLGNASRIELIEPIAEESFLTAFLERHGPGLHHVTLEVADIDATIEQLDTAGVDVVDRKSYGEWTEAFVSPRNATGTLFQLMEYHEAYTENTEHDPESLYVGGERLSSEK